MSCCELLSELRFQVCSRSAGVEWWRKAEGDGFHGVRSVSGFCYGGMLAESGREEM